MLVKNTLCLICEDFWQLDESTVDKSEVELVVVINASPYEYGKFVSRIERAEFLANYFNVPLIYANIVGGQDGLGLMVILL